MQDPAVGPRQDRGLSADRPFASQSPSIQSQTLRCGVDTTSVSRKTARRSKVLGSLVSEVILRGPELRPVSLGFDTTGVD